MGFHQWTLVFTHLFSITFTFTVLNDGVPIEPIAVSITVTEAVSVVVMKQMCGPCGV